jgi:hypothetical protein
MLTEMKKFNFAADGVPSPERLEDTLGVTDFGHFFSFAPTRWT